MKTQQVTFGLLIVISSIIATSIDYFLKENQNMVFKIGSGRINQHVVEITDNKGDLIIDSEIIAGSSYLNSPLIVLSKELIDIDATNKKQWVCNQIAEEVCFVPSSNLKIGDRIYIGVIGENIEYVIKYYFSSETKIELGHAKTFHLNRGEAKTFEIKADVEGPLNIISLSYSKSSYKMTVLSNKTNKEEKVFTNWKNGQESKLEVTNKNDIFNILIVAEEDEAFLLEAYSPESKIHLSKGIRIDAITLENKLCYQLDSNKFKNNEIRVIIKKSNGEATVTLNTKTINLSNQKLGLNVSKEDTLCISSNSSAVVIINCHDKNEGKKSNEYNNNLVKLFEQKNESSFIQEGRRLQEVPEIKTEKPTPIYMTGNGVAGLFLIFFTFFWIYFMVTFLRQIFVSTQWVKEPLFIGKLDS